MKPEDFFYGMMFLGVFVFLVIMVGITFLMAYHEEIDCLNQIQQEASVSYIRTQSLPSYDMVMSKLGQRAEPETPPPQFHELYV